MKRNLNFNKDFKEDIVPLRNNETYTVTDNTFLDNLTVSETILNPHKQTNGHTHDHLDEVYVFTSGKGKIKIDDNIYDCKPGDIFCVKGGEFHQVINDTDMELKFIAIFQKYIRDK